MRQKNTAPRANAVLVLIGATRGVCAAGELSRRGKVFFRPKRGENFTLRNIGKKTYPRAFPHVFGIATGGGCAVGDLQRRGKILFPRNGGERFAQRDIWTRR